MPAPRESVITIGNFDGAHVGHAALVRSARRIADEAPGPNRPRVVVLAFDPHPASVLSPRGTPARLTTWERRAELLRSLGADEVERLRPEPALLDLSPDAFISAVTDRHHAVAIVEGSDFHFGKGRAGSPAVLRDLAMRRGIGVEIVGQVEVELCDQTVVRASSTLVRWLVAHGRVTDARRVLGRPYELTGTVRRGDQRGRTIGIPTANLSTDDGLLIPADGVYAGLATLPDAREYPAAVHVGPRSTFDAPQRTVEAHLIGWDGSGVGEYDWALRIGFTAYLRDQARFDGVKPLVDQITRDVERAARIMTPVIAPEPMESHA